jgi:hypothetical protein
MFATTASGLALGSEVRLLGNILKNKCPSPGDTECASYQYAAAQTVHITNSVNSTPRVVVHAPTVVSNASSFTLDVLSSQGNGGRAWASVHIVARSSTADVESVNAFLNTSYSVDPPTPLPAGLLSAGHAYIFDVTVCNFLGECGVSSHRVEVQQEAAPPTIQIVGPRSWSIFRSTKLQLESVVDSNILEYASLGDLSPVYEWTVHNRKDGSNDILRIQSASQHPHMFSLAPYSLPAGAVVDVTVCLRRSSAQVILSCASVLVQVGHAAPCALHCW